MALVQKRISPDELAQKLVNSRKVMQKVSTGEFERGNIDESSIISNDETPIMTEGLNQMESMPRQNIKPPQPMSVEKIQQSKLPDAIKKAMIENPIPQITMNDGLDINLAAKAKRLMEQDGLSTKSGNKPAPISRNPTKDGGTSQINESKLEKLIENVLRKVLDEKLTQILSAQQLQTINENLVLKVGDSIFQGKITKVKSSK